MLGVKVSVVPCECIIRVVKVRIYYNTPKNDNGIGLDSGPIYKVNIFRGTNQGLYLFI